MPAVEVDEEELKTLRNAKGLLNQLLSDAKTKRNVEQEIKKLHPNTRTTDDFVAPYMDEVRAIGKKVDDFINGYTNEKQDTALNAAFTDLTNPKGAWCLTSEGLEKVKEIMQQRHVADPYAAAALFVRQNPPKPSRPSGLEPTGWGIGAKTKDEDLKLLFEDEDAWLDRELGKIYEERTAEVE